MSLNWPALRVRLADAASPSAGPPLACRYCARAFSQISHRVRHERSVHERRGALPCPACGRAFSRKDNLQLHVRRMHGLELEELQDGGGEPLWSSP